MRNSGAKKNTRENSRLIYIVKRRLKTLWDVMTAGTHKTKKLAENKEQAKRRI
jgi:hypothetical protein